MNVQDSLCGFQRIPLELAILSIYQKAVAPFTNMD